MDSTSEQEGRREGEANPPQQPEPIIPCLMCASGVTVEPETTVGDGVREPSPQEILNCFYKMYKVNTEGLTLWGEEEVLPFCGRCKRQVTSMIKDNKRIEEVVVALHGKFHQGYCEIEACEDAFSEIYKKDRRYFEVRKMVLKSKENDELGGLMLIGHGQMEGDNNESKRSPQIQQEVQTKPLQSSVSTNPQAVQATEFLHSFKSQEVRTEVKQSFQSPTVHAPRLPRVLKSRSVQTEAQITRKVPQSVKNHQSVQTEAQVTRKVQQSVQNHQSVQTDVAASFQAQESVQTKAQLEVATQTDMLESYASDRMLGDDAQKEGNFGCTKLREETQEVMEQTIDNVAGGETTLILAPAAVTIVSKQKSPKRRGKKRTMSQVEDSTTVKPPVVRKLTRNRSVNLESEIAASKELPTPQVTTRQSRNNLRKSTHLEPTAKKSKPSQLDDYEMSPIMSQLKSASGSGAKLNEKIVMNDRITRASTRRRKATITTVNPSSTDDEFEMHSNKEAEKPAKKKYTRKATKQEVDKDFVPYNAANTAKATSNRRNSGRGGARIPDPVTIDEVTGTATFWDVAFKKGNSDKYLCQLCPDPEPLPFAKLKAHAARYHTNLTLCKECGKRHNTVSALNSHIKFVHEKKERKQAISTCPICKKPDVAKRVLSRHIFTHCSKQEIADTVASGKGVPYGVTKAFQCRICGHPYAARGEVERHERTHDITPPVPSQDVNSKKVGNCQICGKYMRDLYYHMRTIHPPTKRFLCIQCDKRFSTYSLLNKHKKWHNLQFACHLCPEKFAMDYALERHVNRHLNKTPFKCQLCISSFTARSYLYKHVKKCHNKL